MRLFILSSPTCSTNRKTTENSMAELNPIRKCATRSAIVFIHGFTGSASGTWSSFPQHLVLENSLSNWNILSLGYPTSLLPGTRGIWSADPNLPILSTAFYTELDILPLSECTDIAIVAHSMGGLIVQRSLVDNPELTAKVRHLFLFGTPSAGIKEANFLTLLFGALVGEQVHNMATDSQFIRDLRTDWNRKFGDRPPFQFLTIAGDKDSFVMPCSSLEPFPKPFQRVVTGDHLSMVKPRDPSADVVRLLISALNRSAEPAGPSSPLRIAAELGSASPEGLALARSAASGEHALNSQTEVVEAALALDRAGQQQEAVKLLENNQRFGSDVKGVLAGRIKRRWVQEGHEADAYWALGLYSDALETARAAQPETNDTISQVFYHAINVAFLKLVAFSDAAAARNMASVALTYAKKTQPPDIWSTATEGEAALHFGDVPQALAKYRLLVSMFPDKWKLMSTGQQAQQIALKLGNTELRDQLKSIFEPPVNQLAASQSSR